MQFFRQEDPTLMHHQNFSATDTLSHQIYDLLHCASIAYDADYLLSHQKQQKIITYQRRYTVVFDAMPQKNLNNDDEALTLLQNYQNKSKETFMNALQTRIHTLRALIEHHNHASSLVQNLAHDFDRENTPSI